VLAAIAVACCVGGFVGAQQRSGRLYFTEGLRNAAIAVKALPNDGRPVLAASQIRLGVSFYLTPSVASRVHDARDYPRGSAGYYLTVIRDGAPLVSDTAPAPRGLGAPYLSVAVDQRRETLWSPHTPEVQDSAVVYLIGPR
jgi:hypothetical protein